MKSEKKTRAPKTGTPVLVRIQDQPLAAVDDWRRRQQDMPSRAEAIRRLIERGLAAEPAKPRRPAKKDNT